MLQLDLIELADLVRPEQLVGEILRQNPNIPVPVPLEDIARLAGITKIEAFSSDGFEGALVANTAKSEGAIFYSARGPTSRQRFTIGHELGHFLLPWHRQSTFQCTAEDISSRAKPEWEQQANQFAAELLMPALLVKKRLKRLADPEIAHIQSLSIEFGTSVEMTARRLTELSDYVCAVVFSKNNVVRYSACSEYFTHWLNVRRGNQLPSKSPSRQESSDPAEWQELDATWWLQEQRGEDMPEVIFEQTLVQDNGHKVTLISYEPG